MPLASMASNLGSLNICASIRKSSSLGPIMSHANKATDIHRTRVDNGTNEALRDSHFAWRDWGLGTGIERLG